MKDILIFSAKVIGCVMLMLGIQTLYREGGLVCEMCADLIVAVMIWMNMDEIRESIFGSKNVENADHRKQRGRTAPN